MPNPGICVSLVEDLITGEELKKKTEESVSYPYISGPIHQNLNKRLASGLLKEEEDEDQLAIFHLTESHGCSLRHQASQRYEVIERRQQSDGDMKTCNVSLLKDIVALDGKYTTLKVQGLHKRLSELPSEWTVIQLTVQFDPLLRFTYQSPDQQRSLHVTRLSCGECSDATNENGQGGPPLTFCVTPYPPSADAVSIVKALKEIVFPEDSNHQTGRCRLKRAKDRAVRNAKLKTLVKEFQDVLRGWNCLLPGHIVDSDLQRTICRKVDKSMKTIAGLGCVSVRTKQLLYLLATSPLEFGKSELEPIKRVIGDDSAARTLFQSLKKIHSEHQDALATAPRHPVIAILDELLDIFPLEMLQVLKEQPVSRVPSIHFAHALYREHQDTVFRTGVGKDDGYFVVNPSGDLQKCESEFRELFSSIVPKWDGLYGQPPTEAQFTHALEDHSILVYCGHGGGNQYASTLEIERIRTKAVSFLFGCSSGKIMSLGGRTQGQSIFNSYMIAGSPCVLGMLWNVTDTDVNSMSKRLLDVWLSSNNKKSEDICERLQEVNLSEIRESQPCRSPTELLSVLPVARTNAEHFMNAAALVARGLPVKLSN